jgi:hypothetical protein
LEEENASTSLLNLMITGAVIIDIDDCVCSLEFRVTKLEVTKIDMKETQGVDS